MNQRATKLIRVSSIKYALHISPPLPLDAPPQEQRKRRNNTVLEANAARKRLKKEYYATTAKTRPAFLKRLRRSIQPVR